MHPNGELKQRLAGAMREARKLQREYWRLRMDLADVMQDSRRILRMSFDAGRGEREINGLYGFGCAGEMG
jgi:hypothetical protein